MTRTAVRGIARNFNSWEFSYIGRHYHSAGVWQSGSIIVGGGTKQVEGKEDDGSNQRKASEKLQTWVTARYGSVI